MNVPTDNLTVLRPYRSSSFDGKDARFYICIHQGSGTEISGEFRHLFMKEWYPFNSLANLILTLDQLLCPSYTLLHYPRLEDYREKRPRFFCISATNSIPAGKGNSSGWRDGAPSISAVFWSLCILLVILL